MLKTTSKARKQNLGLTVPVATHQARAIVDRIMPGVNATVESHRSHDMVNDAPIVVTTVTFPKGHAEALMLRCLLATLPGYVSERSADSSITITRTK